MAVPVLAETCIIDLRGEDELMRRVAFASTDPGFASQARILTDEYPLYRGNLHTAAEALKAGCEAVVANAVEDLPAFMGASTNEQKQVLGEMPRCSALSMPLFYSGKPVGIVTLLSKASRRTFNESDAVKLKYYTTILSDAIEKTRLSHRLRLESARAQSATMYKDALLSTLSHELRTPLQVMLGWTHMLRVTRLSRQAVGKILDSLERSIKAQGHIVNDLLELSRISSGRLELNARPCELSPVLESVLKMVEVSARAKQITLEFAPGSESAWVVADLNWLQRAFRNLLSNAIKFTPDQGKVSVRISKESSHVEVSFTDTGKGIESEFAPHLFERFSQAESGMTRNFGGLGIGLAIVRNVVEAHGGSVEARSEGKDQGATFVVRLPDCKPSECPQAPPKAEEPPKAAQSSLQGVRVLLVEDQQDTRELLRFILEQAGATVTESPNAKMSIQLLQQCLFNVMVCDIGLPEEDGYWLIRKIRALPPGSGGEIPAMALTAYARGENRVQLLRAGFQMHVLKPVEPSELILAVSSLVKRPAPA
jgi:signal transduction histidine kinase/ActR/RegA family two-component response regulator